MISRMEYDLKCRTIAVELAEEMIKYAKIKSPNVIFMGALIHNFQKKDAKIKSHFENAQNYTKSSSKNVRKHTKVL